MQTWAAILAANVVELFCAAGRSIVAGRQPEHVAAKQAI